MIREGRKMPRHFSNLFVFAQRRRSFSVLFIESACTFSLSVLGIADRLSLVCRPEAGSACTLKSDKDYRICLISALHHLMPPAARRCHPEVLGERKDAE